MSSADGIMPREVNIGYVVDRRTGGLHNVLEVCEKTRGMRYVMAQDDETAKERDQYKLRAHLQADRIAELETIIKAAPHDHYCLGDDGDAFCSCWKSRAGEQAQ